MFESIDLIHRYTRAKAIEAAHNKATDSETRERLWDLRCKIDKRVRRIYRYGREAKRQTA